MKENRLIPQNKLRSIINQAIASASNVYTEGSPRQLRILRISTQ
ncbi:3743_t:CDS:1, partial [Entrophospora sp. SA101]